jgi:hypothetical protein
METSVVSKVAPICKLKDIVDFSAVNGDLFVVSHKSFGQHAALVYPNNGFNNSDRVRQAFAKKNGCKFVDVRCCKLKNANK